MDNEDKIEELEFYITIARTIKEERDRIDKLLEIVKELLEIVEDIEKRIRKLEMNERPFGSIHRRGGIS